MRQGKRERNTSKETLKCREHADGHQRGGEWGTGERGDGDEEGVHLLSMRTG